MLREGYARLWLVVCLLLAAGFTAAISVAGGNTPESAESIAAGSEGATPTDFDRYAVSDGFCFTENLGQWDKEVLFRAEIRGGAIWFARDAVYYELRSGVAGSSSAEASVGSSYNVVKSRLLDNNSEMRVAGDGLLRHETNFLVGDERSEWRPGARNYAAIVYHEIYEGIDLKFYGHDHELEYDYIVHPGADPGQIEARFENVDGVGLDGNGNLALCCEGTNLTQRAPRCYQVVADDTIPIQGEFAIDESKTLGFKVDKSYDESLALVIDPVLVFSTYIGGDTADVSGHIYVDEYGYVYVSGATTSRNFPGSHVKSGTRDFEDYDIFVAKLTPNADDFVYCSIMGGGDWDMAGAFVVDQAGQLYLSGDSRSPFFPCSPTGVPMGQFDDAAFALQLSADGSDIMGSKKFNGEHSDYASGIALSASGSIFMCGETRSDSFPTVNALQSQSPDGTLGTDGFVVKISSNWQSIYFSTYFGGSETDGITDMLVDEYGDCFLVGWSYSDDLPGARSLAGSSLNTNYSQVFVSSLSSSGQTVYFTTLFGGSHNDRGFGIAQDDYGDLYVCGSTYSPDFPTINAFQSQYGGGSLDGFVAKLDPFGTSLLYSSYLGGEDYDACSEIATTSDGRCVVSGRTESSDFPLVRPIQESFGFVDIFVAEVEQGGGELIFSTLLGSPYLDLSGGMCLDPNQEHIYLSGGASRRFPTTPGVVQTQNAGFRDAFVCQLPEIDLDIDLVARIWGANQAVSGESHKYVIKYDNILTHTAYDAEITVVLPGEVAYVSSSPAGTYDGETLEWSVGTLSGGQAGQIEIDVEIPSEVAVGDRISALLEIKSNSGEADWLNNSDSLVEVVLDEAEPFAKLASPPGFGDSCWIAARQLTKYVIYYQNPAGSGSNVHNITIMDTLDSDIDPATVTFGPMSFQPFCNFYYYPSPGYLIWEFTGVNLPPNNYPPDGEGYVTFFAKPAEDVSDGDVIANQAVVKFDGGNWFTIPVNNDSLIRTVDRAIPFVWLNSLPDPNPGRVINVTWSGNDGTGSGILSYSLEVSVDGSESTPWFESSVAGSAAFWGEYGRRYCFKCSAYDSVGNQNYTTTSRCTTPVPNEVRDYCELDLDKDGSLGIGDVTTLIYLLYRSEDSGEIPSDADVNGDGLFNLTDVVTLRAALPKCDEVSPVW